MTNRDIFYVCTLVGLTVFAASATFAIRDMHKLITVNSLKCECRAEVLRTLAQELRALEDALMTTNLSATNYIITVTPWGGETLP